jgi:hypothetical protein
MAVSLMKFCSYLPYIFVGAFSDRHNKKIIMFTTYLLAAVVCPNDVLRKVKFIRCISIKTAASKFKI